MPGFKKGVAGGGGYIYEWARDGARDGEDGEGYVEDGERDGEEDERDDEPRRDQEERK